MFLTEIVDLSNVYITKRTKNRNLNIITYNFKTDDDYNFSVDFIYDGDGVWNRHFSTFENQFDEINSQERFKILNTITKNTLDFIEKYEPKKIKIYHVRSRSEFENNPNDENKRTRVNKYFLEKVLPSNYKIKTFGNNTEIDLVENKLNLKSRANDQEKQAIEYYTKKIMDGQYDDVPSNIFNKLPNDIKVKYIKYMVNKGWVLDNEEFTLIPDDLKLKYIKVRINNGWGMSDTQFDFAPYDLKLKYIGNLISQNYFLDNNKFNLLSDDLKLKYIDKFDVISDEKFNLLSDDLKLKYIENRINKGKWYLEDYQKEWYRNYKEKYKLNETKKPINEIAELTNTYSYEKISSDGDKVKYRFSDGEDIFFVKFQLLSIGKFGEEYEREYYTTNRWGDELNKGNILRIIGTVTKITLDFINDYKPGLIQISHIDSNKEIIGRFSIDAILSGNKTKNSVENKRAKINRLFLSKNLPDNYSMEFISNITNIKRND
jgi:hypothetical protein